MRWNIPPPRVSVPPFVRSFVHRSFVVPRRRSFVHFAPFSLSLSLSLILVALPFVLSSPLSLFSPMESSERARMGAVFADSRACSFWTLKRFLPHVFGDGRRSEERTTAAAEGTTERTNERTGGILGNGRGRERGSEHRHLLPASFQAPQPIPYIEWGAVGWREQGTANRGMDIGSRDGKGGREKE